MKRTTFLMIIIVFLLSTHSASYASYINDGSLVILRSQFLDDFQDVNIDGVLDEDIWDKAGSLTVSFSQPDNITIKMLFTNSPNWLFFAVVATELPNNEFDSLLLTFDTEADGNLVSPEDAISINSGLTVFDSYWDGETWKADESNIGNDFSSKVRRTSSEKIFEMRKSLTPENVIYNGFRIPNPSNTFISFNLQYIETQDVNETFAVPVEFNFPSSPTNSSGYVDLKLAGPEDQDLQEFIPPQTITETDSGNNQVTVTLRETIAAALPFNYVLFPLAIAISLKTTKRRKQQ